jgi:hypothetical protein
MQVTILANENVIFIDGKGKALNCEGLRGKGVSTVYWYGKRGDIVSGGGGVRQFAKLDAKLIGTGHSVESLIAMAKEFGASFAPLRMK